MIDIIPYNPSISSDYFEDIRIIYITNEYITEVPRWISKCKNLQTLDLRGNCIKNVEHVTSLTNLLNLLVNNNDICFVQNLSNLINLNNCHIPCNYMCSLSVFDGLPNLRYLNVSNNHLNEEEINDFISHNPHVTLL